MFLLLKTRARPFVLCSSVIYNIACMYDYLWTHLGPPTPSISRQASMCSWVVSSTTNTSSILGLKDRVLHIRGARTGSFTSEGQGQGPSHQGLKDRVLHIRRRGGQGRVALSASSLLPCCCLWPGCKSVLLLKHNNTFISGTIILLLLLPFTTSDCM